MTKKNILGLVFAIIMVVSCFFPWIESSVTGNIGEYDSSFSSGGMSGIMLGYGIFGAIIGVVGAILAWIGFRFSFVIGAIGLLDGIALMVGWGTNEASFSAEGFSTSVSLDPQWGLFLFIGSSFFYTLSALIQLVENDHTSAKMKNFLVC